MNANDLRCRIFNLEAELDIIRVRGVFRLVPQREKRSDGKGEWLNFKSRGAIIVDRNVAYVRRLSLPLERNENKANMLLRKCERTKKAEKIVVEINTLKNKLKEQRIKAAEAAELIKKSHELKYTAEEFANKAADYIAEANVLRNRAAYYAQQAAALQLA